MIRSALGTSQGLENLLEEFAARLEAGEAVDVAAFAAAHPEHAEQLRRVLPTMLVLADLGRSASAGGAAPPAAGAGPEPAPGVLGDFRIIREVGRGGMGVVYEAEQLSLGRRVALKVLPFAGVLDSRQLQRFVNEARAAACLHHPNIVPVHGVGSERGVHFYAMQLIEGRTLAHVIRELGRAEGPNAAGAEEERTVPYAPGAPLPSPCATTMATHADTTKLTARARDHFREVARLGAQAAEALEHAHQTGVLHRDVKPANLLLDDRGNLWVTDFGLAHIQHGDGNLTLTGDLVGTLRYMSPEQALAKRVAVDHRTDVYSLGATLYELLTLRPAFGGTDRQELLRQVAFEEPIAPRKLTRGIPAELETIVLKAMEKSPADRYATAQELADDLRNFLEDRPIHARRPGLHQRLRKWARRHQAAVSAAAVCLLVSLAAVAGSAGWVLGERKARQREAEARVLEALEEAAPGLRRGNPHDPALTAVVQRAEAQRDAGGVGAEVRARVEQLRRDVEMLARLENARLQAAAGSKETGFDYAGADRLYAQAFERYNLDVTSLGSPQAVERIRSSAIRTSLVAALDDWDYVRESLHRGTGASLRALADRADDDPWRQRLRRAQRRGDRAGLEKLAEAKEVWSQPPVNLHLLALALGSARSEAAAERLLRRAQAEHPADFWINLYLAETLSDKKPPDWAQVVRFAQTAQALRPQSAVASLNLGAALAHQRRLVEAEAALRKAIQLQPDFALAHTNLGGVLGIQGKLVEAEAACRKAIQLQPDLALAHCGLGGILAYQGKLVEAEAAFRKAIALQPDLALAHSGLGGILADQGKLVEAEKACRKAIALQPDLALAHRGLGNTWRQQGRLVEAEKACRKAIQLQPDEAETHNILGAILIDGWRKDEAIAEFRTAIRLKKNDPRFHYNLGRALVHKGRLDDAIAEYQIALKLREAYPEAHCNLGQLLRRKGQFRQAVEHLRRGHELGSRDPTRWPYPSARWLRQAEQMAQAEASLPAVLSGKAQPRDAEECLAFAKLCQERRAFAAAARFYAEAFARRPALAADLQPGYRYDAACAAALAGCRQGQGAADLSPKERAQLRRQALDWLRRDLAAWRTLLEKGPDVARPVIVKQLRHWLADADFAGMRGPDALASLPEAERPAWQELWADVADTLARAEKKPAQPKKSGRK
jgi:tetratricopeptide (TPR) repeat protein